MLTIQSKVVVFWPEFSPSKGKCLGTSGIETNEVTVAYETSWSNLYVSQVSNIFHLKLASLPASRCFTS